MSYLTSAMKQSQQGADAEQDYLSQRQDAQLIFYKKLVTYAGAGLLSLSSLGAGYYIGKITTPAEVQPAVTSKEEPKKEEQAELSTDLAVENNQQVKKANVASQEVSTPTTTSATNNTVNPNLAAQTAEPEQHFQWVSVQIGVDNQGKPLYQQQLVPVDSVKAVAVVPAPVPTSDAIQPNQATQDSSPGEIQTAGEYAGYRVFGAKPKLQDDELAGVSEELKKAFAEAVKETAPHEEPEVLSTTKDSASATPIALLPAQLQNSIPSLRYQAHIYATDSHERWIKINNRPLYEGDSLGALTVVEITPEQTRFDFDGIEFSLEAMEDWLP
ncbi:general secretion pathway protein GspB [Pseudoalteromonas sp. OF7H-1]|uniref:general secretion pathway protein GspB n=1 Tax=Pseudoalteromonas sp. OF7H-1 TaxID=2917755 RepID=UPI001EF6357A|nr:general secretion pathway protein GspB [Pseudoalteromonas sp. OF7H-1]MCG7541852.1 general secretion pathway protein GspB [Pseudoalteromonas sp. OF7H-1]